MANSILSSNSLANNPADMITQFKNFQRNFTGDPKQVVMNMLQQGRINNAQLQQVMQMARNFQSMLK